MGLCLIWPKGGGKGTVRLGIVRALWSFLHRAVDINMVGLAQSKALVLDLAWTSVVNGTLGPCGKLV